MNSKLKICLVNPFRSNTENKEVQLLKDWYQYLSAKPEFSVYFVNAEREGFTNDEIVTRLKSLKPQIIILAADTDNIQDINEFGKVLNNHFHNCPTVISGSFVTSSPDETMNNYTAFDLGIVGKDPVPLVQLWNLLKNRRDGEENIDHSAINNVIGRKHTFPEEDLTD